MKRLVVIGGVATLLLGGLMLWPSLGQHSGRTVVRETVTESRDFIRAGEYTINRNHVAFVVRRGGQTTVYFVGNVPPVLISEGGERLADLLVGEVGSWQGRPNPSTVDPPAFPRELDKKSAEVLSVEPPLQETLPGRPATPVEDRPPTQERTFPKR